ncbi:unnamed protein product [Clonostachys rhizophaga]|uniref:Major facilitator superfamily (MFS) profile domain-containing protein n=1 Tax=Clonostachys rhizophaga TaxID=160324 RepID=A0A9N9VZ27_9HYPO|nr:unnamed protein product [Clonostachys rhizophaga]
MSNEKNELSDREVSSPVVATGEIEEIYSDNERAVLSRFDWLVMPQMAILVIFAYLDRTNIGNARVFGLEESTGMKGNDFNDISMYFYIPYVIFETPWVIAVKKFGPGRVLAVAIVCWSAITLGTGFVNSYREMIAMRVLLGIFEAGLFPALTFVISMIYPRGSQGKRVAVLYISIALSGAFGGLFAYGIQSMGARHGLEAWRWLFIVEGTISFGIGLACWVSLPTSPETAWFLKPEERETMKSIKAKNTTPSSSGTLDWKEVKMAITDPMIYLASASLFCSSIAMFGFSTFLPTILLGLNYTSLQANYLSIPVYVLAAITTGISTFVSDRYNRRAACLIHSPLLVIIGYAICIGSADKAAGFAGMFVVGAGVYSFNSILVTWVSNNTQPDYKRSVAIAMVISVGNISGLVASQIYPASDKPRYIKGNAVSLGLEAGALVSVVLIYTLLRRRMTQKEQLLAEGKTENGKHGDQALDFKYIY